VTRPEVEDSDILTLEVFPDCTIETLRSLIEAEARIPAPSQHLYHNGQLITDSSRTLEQLQISDGEMLTLHIRDMRGNTGVAEPPQRSARNPGQDPETMRLQILGNPQLRAEVQQANPPLASVLEDPQRFAQIFRQSQNQQEEARRARMREIEELNNDEFNPEAQAKIEEIIRQQQVTENLQNAMEHNPECKSRRACILQHISWTCC
jgi:DNA damage-inducible protein 1